MILSLKHPGRPSSPSATQVAPAAENGGFCTHKVPFAVPGVRQPRRPKTLQPFPIHPGQSQIARRAKICGSCNLGGSGVFAGRGIHIHRETGTPEYGVCHQRKGRLRWIHTSSEKITEALKLLEQAATQKRDELKSVMADKYTHLKDIFVETESSLAKSLSDTGKHAGRGGRSRQGMLASQKVRESDMDQNVRRDPWPYIAGTAAVGFVLGFIFSRDRK